MTLTSSLYSNDLVRAQLEHERQAFWQAYAGWSEDAIGRAWSTQLTERLLASNIAHASTPRHLGHGFGVTGTSPALVQGADRARLVGGFSVMDTGRG